MGVRGLNPDSSVSSSVCSESVTVIKGHGQFQTLYSFVYEEILCSCTFALFPFARVESDMRFLMPQEGSELT